VLRGSRRNNFPVLRHGTQNYIGMVDVAAARDVLLEPSLLNVTLVGTIMYQDLPTIQVDTGLSKAMQIFEKGGIWVLPVLDGEAFVGLISKSTLFEHYRRELNAQVQI